MDTLCKAVLMTEGSTLITLKPDIAKAPEPVPASVTITSASLLALFSSITNACNFILISLELLEKKYYNLYNPYLTNGTKLTRNKVMRTILHVSDKI